MSDMALIWAIAVILAVSAVLRIDLARRKGSPLSGAGKLQAVLFPAAFLLAAVLLQAGLADLIMPVLLLGILEEAVCLAIRKRQQDGQGNKKTNGR